MDGQSHERRQYFRGKARPGRVLPVRYRTTLHPRWIEAEMREIDQFDLAEMYRQRKVVILGTLFEDANFAPAKPADLALWGNGLNFVLDIPLVLDPGLALGPYFAQSVTPLNLVLDARTMEILFVQMGYSGSLWAFVDSELANRGIQ